MCIIVTSVNQARTISYLELFVKKTVQVRCRLIERRHLDHVFPVENIIVVIALNHKWMKSHQLCHRRVCMKILNVHKHLLLLKVQINHLLKHLKFQQIRMLLQVQYHVVFQCVVLKMCHQRNLHCSCQMVTIQKVCMHKYVE